MFKIITRIKNAFKSVVSLQEGLRFLFSQYDDEGTLTKDNAYAKHVWVYACVNAIALNIGRVPIKFYSGDKFLENHPVIDLFKYVNPYQNTSELFGGTQIFKNIKGETFWHVISNGSRVVEFEFLDPTKMKEKIINGNLNGWEYTIKGERIPLETADVVHFKYFNLDNYFRGMSPLQAAIKSVEIDDLARRFDKAILKNGAYPGNVLEHPKKMDDVQYRRLKKQFEDRHEGVDKAGKMAILDDGLQLKEVKLTHEEIQYIEQRKMSREEIAAVYKVPPVEIGIFEYANYANSGNQLKQFWTKKLIPEIHYVEDVINTNFLDVWYKGIRCEFDLSVIHELQKEYSDKLEGAEKLWKMGVPLYDINDKLTLGFDLDKYPWTKQWWIGFNLIPAGSAEEPKQAPDKTDKFSNVIKLISQLETEKGEISKETYINYKKWKVLINRVIPIERQYQNKVSRWIFEVRKEILNNFYDAIKKIDLTDTKGIEQTLNQALFDESEQYKKLINLSESYLTDGILAGGKTAIDEIGIEATFELTSQAAIEHLNYLKYKLKDIPETIAKNVKKIINDTLKAGIEEGLTTPQIAENISGNLKHMLDVAGNRAKVIARTEINSAANGGKHLGFRENGVKKRQWLNSFDERVRDVHLEQPTGVGGEVRDIDDNFSNGLLYPGDMSGDPGQVINCRCTTVAIIEE